MVTLAPEIAQMRRSGIREIMDLANRMHDVIHLEVGEPNFDTPAHIREGACQAIHDGYTKYTPNAGLLSLREKLAAKLARVNDLHVTPDDLVVTHGGMGGLVSALAAVVSSGDEVLIPDPGWPNYEMMTYVNKAVPKRYPLRKADGFLPDPALIEEHMGPRTKVLVINSPSNPAGAVFPRQLVQDLVELARKRDLCLISDEVYEQIVFEGKHFSAFSYDTDGRTISVFSFSKTYAMTGWRLGYVIAAPEVANLVAKLQEPLVSSASSVSQKAGEAALDGPQDCIAEMCAAYKRRRDLATILLTELGVPFVRPSGAFYLMVDVSARGMGSYEFAKALLRETRVAVAPGGTFGPSADSAVRLSLATADEQLAEGVRRLAAFLSASGS